MTKEEFLEKYEHRRPFLEWCSGGMDGGNCWGDEATEIYPDEEPKIDDAIWDFLNLFTDNVSDQEFAAIKYAPGLEVEKEWTDNEYYGNYYYRHSKTIDLEVIWPFIELIIDVPESDARKAHYILMED
ncbi:MAG: hypothetical protein M0R77_10450 [Gammaproteobacteria bacterium]|nr:hypothetical protein [Gammaproteobacteria bacterium]